MVRPDEVLAFWLDEVGPNGWYAEDAALDARIRERFHETWQAATEGALSLWLTYPSGALAYIILTDQFPRNMFRGTGRAFSSDAIALAAAKSNLFHARAHREVIRKFGRFPYRNDALSRLPTGAETHYLKQGGYGSTIRALQAAEAA